MPSVSPALRRLPWLTLAIAALAVGIHASPALTAALELNRAAVGAGEWWRLPTGHLTHFDTDHLRWDVAALLVLGALSEPRGRRVFFTTLLVAAAGIGLAVWFFQPQFTSYRGLSGLDSALFGLVCARQIADGRRARHAFSVWVGLLAMLGFVAKCVFELASGGTVFAAGGGTSYAPVPLAHLIGAAVGLLPHRFHAHPDGGETGTRTAVGERPAGRLPHGAVGRRPDLENAPSVLP